MQRIWRFTPSSDDQTLAIIFRDAALPAAVTVAWGASRLVASDALAGGELEEAGAGQVRFRPVSETEIQAIAAGQRRPLGWLRFDGDTEVEVHVTPAP